MGKKISFSISKGQYIIFATFYLVFFYNIFSLPAKLAINNHFSLQENIFLILSELLLTWSLLILFVILFSANKVLLKLLIGLLILVSGGLSYYVIFNKVFIEEVFVASIFETRITDAGKAFNFFSILWFLLFAIIPCIFFVKSLRIKTNKSSFKTRLKDYFKLGRNLIGMALVLIAISFALNSKMYLSSIYVLKSSLSYYQPVNYLAALWQYFTRINTVQVEHLVDISKKYPFTWRDKRIKNKPLTIVLVIGESARSDKQSLNGYSRDTNPNLAKVKNLTSFPYMTSCDTYTISSIHCLLSYKTRKNFKLEIKETHLLSVFQKLNFDTYFISSQTMYNSLPFMLFMKEGANKFVFGNQVRVNIPSGSDDYDEYLLPFVKKYNEESKNKHKFFIVHLIGSHTPYQIRYPKRFNKFGDTNIQDSYDNTILYTDYILSSLITYFSNSNTLLFYTSDHGESLGENGIFLHGAKYELAPKEQIHIPLFVWASNSMIKIMGNKYKNIRLKKNQQVSHDYIFSSLFDCLGITSSVVKKNLSLCK